jgi:hypothetical protein
VTAKNWRDHGIPNRWDEKVDRRIHPHVKPIRLIERLIGAVTLPGDLVIDPAAGGFGVLHAALGLGREFIGCDAVLLQALERGLAIDDPAVAAKEQAALRRENAEPRKQLEAARGAEPLAGNDPGPLPEILVRQ